MEILSFGLLIIIMLVWTLAFVSISTLKRNNRYM